MSFISSILSILIFSGSLFVVSSFADEKVDEDLKEVTLQLKWKHQFQFAGYYAAIKKGFYREEGLKVILKEPTLNSNVVDLVIDNKAEFGISASDLILRRSQGDPVVALAVIYQHSPYALATNPEITQLNQLVGKPVSLETQSAEILAMFRREGLNESEVKLMEHRFHIEDLLKGKIDALSIYTSDETYDLQQAQYDYTLFSPRAYGIDFYGDTLFTSERMLKSQPEVVEKFRKASLKGWRYALEHSEEMIDVIREQYSIRHSLEHLRFEVEKARVFVMADMLEIGYMHMWRWRHILNTYKSIGLIEPHRLVDFKSFIYKPPVQQDNTRFYFILGLVCLILFVVANIALAFFRLNRRLKIQISESDALRGELEQMAFTDFLTGVANRRYFVQSFNSELERIKRNKTDMALIEIDLDHFKNINDTHGHLFGDSALCHFVKMTQSILRHNDIFGRTGGEEFCVVLPETDMKGAQVFADRLMAKLDETPIPDDNKKVLLSASMGISNIRPNDSVDEVIGRADDALYEAKESGRHAIRFKIVED
jgi:diguanylate cyclase (GGDEF)-like protein